MGNNIFSKLSLERICAMESLRNRLIDIIKTLPEDRLQIVLDFVNRINQNSFVANDFAQLQMNNEE